MLLASLSLPSHPLTLLLDSSLPIASKHRPANRAIELDLDQPTPTTRPVPSIVSPSSVPLSHGTTQAKPVPATVPDSPLPLLSPPTPPQSPPSVIPLPSLQPVASSSSAGLFLGPLQSSSRWSGQLYFNGHNTNISFTGRLMGVAGQCHSNSAVKALSTLPASPAIINIAGREPTGDAAKLLNECVNSARLMALLYILQPDAADAAAMEQFCAFHAEKQRVAIADMRRESGLFYRFGRMSAMGEPMGRELPLDVFARCFSGVKGLKDAGSYYCVVVYAAKRTTGGVGSAIAPQRQESSSSVSSVASSESSKVSSSRQRSSQASVVTPPPPVQPALPVYPAFPAPAAAAQPSAFTSPPFASPAPLPAPTLPTPAAFPAPAVAPPAPAAYTGYQPPPPAAGYYVPASQYPSYLPIIPEQQMPNAPPHPYPQYPPPQLNPPVYSQQPQYHTQPHSQPQSQPQPPPYQAAAPPATGRGAVVGSAAAANTDWNQVRKFLETIKTLGTSSPSATAPSPPTSQPPAIPPPSPPRPHQSPNAPFHSPRREDGAAGRFREGDRVRAGRPENERDGVQQMDTRRRYEVEGQRVEEDRVRQEAQRRDTDRIARESDRMHERDRRREYDRDGERDRDRDRPVDQPRVYDSSRERERERERAETQHRPRGAGGAGGYELQRERIDRELREAERERDRLSQLTAPRIPTNYTQPPPPSSSSQQPPRTTVSGYIHPSRLAQAPR